LAGETDAEIARKHSISPEAVDLYEGLFFCVRDRLECRGWIAATIHGMAGRPVFYGTDGLTEQQRHTVYRLFGYLGGPGILDAMVGTLSPRLRPLKPEDLVAWLDDKLRAGIRRAAMMAVAKFNKKNCRQLFRMHRKLMKKKRKKKTDRTPEESLKKSIAACIESLRCLEGLPKHPA